MMASMQQRLADLLVGPREDLDCEIKNWLDLTESGEAKVTPSDYVIDLGSGDGRTVITAAKRGTRAHGIEYNPDMVALSKRAAAKEGVSGKATFAKAVIALANHGGGFVVFGLVQTATGFAKADDCPPTLDAYGQDLINGILANYCDPSLHCAVHFVAAPKALAMAISMPLLSALFITSSSLSPTSSPLLIISTTMS